MAGKTIPFRPHNAKRPRLNGGVVAHRPRPEIEEKEVRDWLSVFAIA